MSLGTNKHRYAKPRLKPRKHGPGRRRCKGNNSRSLTDEQQAALRVMRNPKSPKKVVEEFRPVTPPVAKATPPKPLFPGARKVTSYKEYLDCPHCNHYSSHLQLPRTLVETDRGPRHYITCANSACRKEFWVETA